MKIKITESQLRKVIREEIDSISASKRNFFLKESEIKALLHLDRNLKRLNENPLAIPMALRHALAASEIISTILSSKHGRSAVIALLKAIKLTSGSMPIQKITIPIISKAINMLTKTLGYDFSLDPQQVFESIKIFLPNYWADLLIDKVIGYLETMSDEEWIDMVKTPQGAPPQGAPPQDASKASSGPPPIPKELGKTMVPRFAESRKVSKRS